LALAKKEL
jgi:hypothetical protein